jgi:hypothetical protein
MLRSVAAWEITDVSGGSRFLRLQESSSSILVTTARLLNAKAPRYSEMSGITASQPERLESFATPLREPRISHGNYHLHHVGLFTLPRHFYNYFPLFTYSFITPPNRVTRFKRWTLLACIRQVPSSNLGHDSDLLRFRRGVPQQIPEYFLKLVHTCLLSHPFWSLFTVTSPSEVVQFSDKSHYIKHMWVHRLSNQFKIPDATRATWRKIHTEDPRGAWRLHTPAYI